MDAAGMGVEIVRGVGEREERGVYFHDTLHIDPYTTATSTIAMSKELRYDRHTVSLLMDHMVYSHKYRGKVLVGDVAILAEAIIRKTCKKLDIKIIDMGSKPGSCAFVYQIPAKIFRKLFIEDDQR